MPIIHFLRHAQSTFNASDGDLDELDSNLSPRGIEQAKAVVGHFDLVIMSPMRRCWQTLQTSQITYKNIITLEDAREMKYKKCDFKEGEDFTLTETDADMVARMRRLRENLWYFLTPGKTVLLVAHYNTLRFLTCDVIDGEIQWNGVEMKNAQMKEYNLKYEMPRIHFLRHAQSANNVSWDAGLGALDVYDCSLSPLGIEQAKPVVGDFDLVLISPLKRCWETLQASQITYEKIITLEDAREKKYGKPDFKEGEDFTQLESDADMVARMRRLKEQVLPYLSPYKSVLLVAHHYTVKFLTSNLDNEEVECDGLQLGNAELKEYVFRSKMPEIHFLRHAESTHNASGGSLDEFDAEISPLGVEQAAAVVGDFDLVLISPMRRCWQTLQTSQITYKDIVTLEDAREMRHTKADLKEGEDVPSKVENAADMIERMARLRDQILAHLSPDKKVLLVAHFLTIHYLTSDVTDGKLKIVCQKRRLGSGLSMNNAEIKNYRFRWPNESVEEGSKCDITEEHRHCNITNTEKSLSAVVQSDSKTLQLHFLRHAQSTHNASGGSLDEFDAEITPLGEEQARTVVGDYDLVLISPMRRCWQTLQASQITYKDIVTLDDAREMRKSKSDFKEGEDPSKTEEDADMLQRMTRLMRRILTLVSADKRVLLVAHYNTIKYLTSDVIEGEVTWNKEYCDMKNAEIKEYEINWSAGPLEEPILYDCTEAVELQVQPDDNDRIKIVREDIGDFGDTGFLLHGVLSRGECERIIAAGEKLGFSDLYGVDKAHRNMFRIVVESPALLEAIYSRIRPFLTEDFVVSSDPHSHYIHGVTSMLQGTWKPVALNTIMRLCHYNSGGHFGPHYDGCFTKSATERSMKTIMLYLNDGFGGGDTAFIDDKQQLYKDASGRYIAEDDNVMKRVSAGPGTAILFNHHRLHQGSPLTSGKKYFLRTDVMYEKCGGPSVPPEDQEALLLVQEAERLEQQGDNMAAMRLYRKAFKLSPAIEKSYGS